MRDGGRPELDGLLAAVEAEHQLLVVASGPVLHRNGPRVLNARGRYRQPRVISLSPLGRGGLHPLPWGPAAVKRPRTAVRPDLSPGGGGGKGISAIDTVWSALDDQEGF